MPKLTTHLLELTQLGSEITGVLDLPQKYWPQPGKYLACQRLGDAERIATPLFRVFGNPGQPSLAPISEAWNPGDRLVFSPPQGRGFELPKPTRRVGLIPFNVSPARVLSLVDSALSQGAEVALFCDPGLPVDVLNRIPSRVEILPLSSLAEDPTWPDYVAVDLDRLDLVSLMEQVDLVNLPGSVEVLVRTPMPCFGIGACGVCAVQTQRGFRFTCTDGPVFPLKGLRHVA